jgi:outer membrane PBP1 activator LpoA protein
LAQTTHNGKPLQLFDTGTEAMGAAQAAARAAKSGARVLVGPVFGSQLRAAAQAAGVAIPVISFTNDIDARAANGFVFGVTPSQSVSAILQYARSRGVRSVAAIAARTRWGQQSVAAAQRVAADIDIRVFAIQDQYEASDRDLLRALERATPAGPPDAVLLTHGGAEFLAYANQLKLSYQLLGTSNVLDGSLSALDGIDGSWIAAPDPQKINAFSRNFPARQASTVNLSHALGYDAVSIANRILLAPSPARALVSAPGFPGVAGAVRFREDGSCVRELSILNIAQGRAVPVDRRAGV